jgi:hypothetical protein
MVRGDCAGYLSAVSSTIMDGKGERKRKQTVGPQERTASSAAAVLQCSRIMRRLGNFLCRDRRVGRNAGSALRIVMACCCCCFSSLGMWAWVGVEGTSPCRFSLIFWASISAKTG